MYSVFDQQHYSDLVNRVNKISATTTPAWGKMNGAQMFHHLNLAMETAIGKYTPKGKPVFFMRPFRAVLYNDKPFGKGAPTPKDFRITGQFNFEEEKQRALQNLKTIYERGINGAYEPHVFFGKLTNEQWGMHIFKHADHHMKQFGV